MRRLESTLNQKLRYIRRASSFVVRKNLGLLKSPKATLRLALAHARLLQIGLPKVDFVQKLTRASRVDALEALRWAEVATNEILTRSARMDGVPRDQITGAIEEEIGKVLYALVLLVQPEVVVETGVGPGQSSAFILAAMDRLAKGQLYSIDWNSPGVALRDGLAYYVPPDLRTGWLVPDRLRGRWHFTEGMAEEILPPLLGKLVNIDIFLHDSLHTYEHQSFEYRAAWRSIRDGGLLLTHDAGPAFVDFSVEVRNVAVAFFNMAGMRRGNRDG